MRREIRIVAQIEADDDREPAFILVDTLRALADGILAGRTKGSLPDGGDYLVRGLEPVLKRLSEREIKE